jgi:hypothetical protein
MITTVVQSAKQLWDDVAMLGDFWGAKILPW